MGEFSAAGESTVLVMANDTFNSPALPSLNLQSDQISLVDPGSSQVEAVGPVCNESLSMNQLNNFSQSNHITCEGNRDRPMDPRKAPDIQHNFKVNVAEEDKDIVGGCNLSQEEVNCPESTSVTLSQEKSSVLPIGPNDHFQNDSSNSETVISKSLERTVTLHSEGKTGDEKGKHVHVNEQSVEKLDEESKSDCQDGTKENLTAELSKEPDHVFPTVGSSHHRASEIDTDFNSIESEHSQVSISSVENNLRSGPENSSIVKECIGISLAVEEISPSSVSGCAIAPFHQTMQYETNNDLHLVGSSVSNVSDINVIGFSETMEKGDNSQCSVKGKSFACELLSNPVKGEAPCNISTSALALNEHDPDITIAPDVLLKSCEAASLDNQSKNLMNSRDNDKTLSNSVADSDNPCKILTKYVLINKKQKHKSSSKSFGFLYRNAFRHFQGAKNRKASPNKGKAKDPRIKSVLKKKQTSKTKTNTLENDLVEANLHKKELKQAKNNSREERRKTRELKKEQIPVENKSRENEKDNSANGRNHKRFNKVANRKLAKESKKKVPEQKSSEQENHCMSREKKSKKKRLASRNILNLETKLAIIQAMEKGSKSTVKVGREFNVSRTNVWRIMKKKKEILAETENPEYSEKKKKQKKSKIKENEIKQEVGEEGGLRSLDEMFSNGEEYVDTVGENLGVGNRRKGKMRAVRKDLTLEEKVQVVQGLEQPGMKIVTMAKKFGVSTSAISRINKNREWIKLKSASGDMSINQKRSRESKDPELDKVLLKWYRAVEDLEQKHISISNVLLKEKAHSLAITMGKDYFPSDNWILRWKNRHNIMSKINTIHDREKLKELDEQVNISKILEDLGQQEYKIDEVKREKLLRHGEKPEEFLICEHCGVLISTKRKKENSHLVGCPSSAIRKDLTLEEKVQVVKALEQPGVKMVALAKKYGVSSSAISRINKNRVDILARRASGLANFNRRRDRGSKEPEVERVLCEWFKVQHELGIHTSGSMIREKARDIARVMGKNFWPSESWVFRWRHRNNVNDMNSFLYGDSEEDENIKVRTNDTDNNDKNSIPCHTEADTSAGGSGDGEEEYAEDSGNGNEQKKRKKDEAEKVQVVGKRLRLPRSVMCEKCGFVSNRIKNNRIKSIRHAKGCPDLKPRNELTYENRAKMLKALEEPGATLSSVARQFGVSVSSMSRMNQKKEHILSHGQDHGTQKRIRDCKEPEVAANLYNWYKERKDEGVHVTGPKLKEKAKKLAAEMGREFKASSGWLGRWRHRYNLTNSVKSPEKVVSEPVKKRKTKRNSITKADLDGDHQLTRLQPIPTDIQPDNSVGSAASVIVEPLEPILPPPPPPQPVPTQIFIHQRFQSPWEMAQPQAASCVWPKDFISPQGSGLQEETGVPVSYSYPESVPKPVFHNMFESFSGMGYQVAVPVESTMLNREYLKQDAATEDKPGSSTSHTVPHTTHPLHPQHSHHLPASLSAQVPHMQHHIPSASHQHHLSQAHQPAVSHNPQQPSHALPAPSTANQDEDVEQQKQVMEAFKIMSSFAQKKSLGDHVQAALRTIEMSMKNPQRKSSPRNTYTSI